MTERGALGEFLRSRRGRIGPAEAGLPAGLGRRQTPGLRREELAALAGVSVDYYTRLEQGRNLNPGAGVLDALASALQLDDDGRAHLHALAGNAASRPAPRRAAVTVLPGLRRLLETIRPAPGYVLDETSNILAANPEGIQLMAGLDAWPAARRNVIRYVFTHPAARDLFVSWPEIATDSVADLRSAAAAHPGSPELAALVTELTAASAEFARLWQCYDVRVNRGGRRGFRHPDVGLFELTSEVLTAASGQRLLIFQADNSAARDAITLLTLAATPPR